MTLASIFALAGCTSSSLPVGHDGGVDSGVGHDGGGNRGDGGHTGYACASDSDCVWRDSGCCGVCANRTDQVPPPLGCGIACPIEMGGCLCVAGHCQAGSLPPNASCDPNHDACGPNTKCCATCCGVPPQGDMSLDPDPRCVQPDFNSSPPMCPPIA